MNDWFQEWKRVYKIPSDLTRKSLKLYDEKYHKYIGPAVGKMRLRDVRDIQLQSILNEQRGMSFSHVTKLRMVMQEIFHQAYRSMFTRQWKVEQTPSRHQRLLRESGIFQ